MEAMANHLIDQFRVKPKTGVRLQDFDSNLSLIHI